MSKQTAPADTPDFATLYHDLQAQIAQQTADAEKAQKLKDAKAAKKAAMAVIAAESAALDIEAIGDNILTAVAEHGGAVGRATLANVAADCGAATVTACQKTVLAFLAIGVKNACDADKRANAVNKALDPVGTLATKGAKA